MTEDPGAWRSGGGADLPFGLPLTFSSYAPAFCVEKRETQEGNRSLQPARVRTGTFAVCKGTD